MSECNFGSSTVAGQEEIHRREMYKVRHSYEFHTKSVAFLIYLNYWDCSQRYVIYDVTYFAFSSFVQISWRYT